MQNSPIHYSDWCLLEVVGIPHLENPIPGDRTQRTPELANYPRDPHLNDQENHEPQVGCKNEHLGDQAEDTEAKIYRDRPTLQAPCPNDTAERSDDECGLNQAYSPQRYPFDSVASSSPALDEARPEDYIADQLEDEVDQTEAHDRVPQAEDNELIGRQIWDGLHKDRPRREARCADGHGVRVHGHALHNGSVRKMRRLAHLGLLHLPGCALVLRCTGGHCSAVLPLSTRVH
mmetsp:Transcript_78367/g.212084  ORF Transcript_78367/g.212084 Transcript_78367/m.212084 type:complete len:232 (-) Transcript_78367:35-730(-)